jgi:acetaldehyde dehydrogenase (acetylating)
MGMMAITISADISPHMMEVGAWKEESCTVTVLATSRVRMRANINSFQENIKQKMAVTTIPGATRGKTILIMALTLEHPSTIAASSMSLGNSSKKPVNSHTEKATLKVQ